MFRALRVSACKSLEENSCTHPNPEAGILAHWQCSHLSILRKVTRKNEKQKYLKTTACAGRFTNGSRSQHSKQASVVNISARSCADPIFNTLQREMDA